MPRSVSDVQTGSIDEVITVLGKIERRLEPRAHREQLGARFTDRARQRAFELVACGARLCRRYRLDEIGDGLGLHKIELAVKESAERELAGQRWSRALVHRTPHYPTEGFPWPLISTTSSPMQNAGRKPRADDLIHDAPGLAGTRVFADVTERGATRLGQIRHPKQRTSNLGGPIAAYAHDADPAPSGRRGDGNDRIVLAVKFVGLWRNPQVPPDGIRAPRCSARRGRLFQADNDELDRAIAEAF